MCCIFTCVGWIIDLVQRLWTFTMSCLISSAICCSMATASMSGIALGYNYSLAEYIDLKETNVSVYLKRGVFDDEVADDMEWRRSGHMPVEGHLRDSNLMTAPPNNEEMPLRPGRRMDDSLVVSDDHHKYEGSLMRLTVKPPSYKSSAEPVTSDGKMAEVLRQFPSGSMEQIKAIHSVLNQRRANNFQRNTKKTTLNEMPSMAPDILGRRMGGIAPGGVPMYGPGYQPMYERNPGEINPARFAVPDSNIGEAANWFLPKDKAPESYRRTMDQEATNLPVSIYTYPSAIIFTKDLKRPTRPRPKEEIKPTHTSGTTLDGGDAPEDEIKKYKEMLLRERENRERLDNLRIQKIGDREFDLGKEFKSEEDYAEQAMKGLPLKQWTTSNMIRNPEMSD